MSSGELLHEARRALGIDQLVLAVHDASFPSAPGEDAGRGSPYSGGARDLHDEIGCAVDKCSLQDRLALSSDEKQIRQTPPAPRLM